MTDHTITVRDSACATIVRMREQTALAEEAWKGKRDAEVLKMALSLGKVLEGLLTGGWGPATIHWDGDLSLVTTTQTGFTFGTIFHAFDRPDVPTEDAVRVTWGVQAAREGLYCMAGVAGQYCGQPIVRSEPTCEGHDPFPVAMPVLGDWSFHS